jgi:tRNA-dihydrouridine synthase C
MRKLLLAPMEGVMDFIYRDLITARGGVDQATTEFIRVTDKLLPDHVFFKYAPELKMNSQTRAGTELYVQLLGGQPEPLAANAQRLCELGAKGIDLNFGCPAKTVNRHDGGASLLQYPERIFNIVKTVRNAMPAPIPLTTKMRLGFNSTDLCFENAKAMTEGGSCRLTVHARLKIDGYKPPAHWEWLPKIQEKISIPVVANGEIWNSQDLERCASETGCQQFMIGRGVLRNPSLIAELKGLKAATTWQEQKILLLPFFEANEIAVSSQFALSRSKQMLKLLSQQYPEADEIFQQVKVNLIAHQYRSELEKILFDK